MSNKEHPVISVILERYNNSSKPNNRNDKHKVALAIEGGAMRGVVSAGMVTALEYLDLTDAFDVFYGTSAGGFNAAFYLAGQAAYGTTIYYENINNNKFIDVKRLFSKDPIVSIDFLIDHVCKKEKILDCQAIINAPIPLKIIATSVDRCEPVILEDFKHTQDVLEALRATARIAVLGGPPVKINGELLLDGANVESVPFPSAINEGCTHILVLLTHSTGYQKKNTNAIEKSLFIRPLAKDYPDFVRTMIERPQKYNDNNKYLNEKTKEPGNSPYIYAISVPPTAKKVSRLEKDRQAIVRGAMDGMDAVLDIFTGSNSEVTTEIICPYDSAGHKIKLKK